MMSPSENSPTPHSPAAGSPAAHSPADAPGTAPSNTTSGPGNTTSAPGNAPTERFASTGSHPEPARHPEPAGHPGPASDMDPAHRGPSTADPAARYAGHGQQHEAPVARAGTIVWGLIAVVLGLGSMAVALGRGVDIEIALIFLFLLAGLGLLVGSVISAAQRARRGRQRSARARS